MNLYERMEAGTPFDKDIFLEGVDRGIRHLHSLGIVHNDINPSNIMFDEMDRHVIIDFDCWQQNGQELGIKMGTKDWLIEGAELALFENDIFLLSKIKDFLFASSSRDPLTESTSAVANASKAPTPATAKIGGPQDALDSN
ncbi:hypothetical protein E4U23_002441 [Claviceps purpurea]|nr:hypothetical protein E4U23_002441 [Claviceps purpurea]